MQLHFISSISHQVSTWVTLRVIPVLGDMDGIGWCGRDYDGILCK